MDNNNNNENNGFNNDVNNPKETNKIFNKELHNLSNDSNNKIQKFLKKLLVLSNIESNFVKIFGIDKLWIPLLLFLKKMMLSKIPILNKYIFKEKTSSLTISYTHHNSTYYNQQNNSTEYAIYRSILSYVYDKKTFGSKFTSNANGNFMFFEQFDEIQINKKIWLSSKNTVSNTSSIYTLELLSYTSGIDEINNFIKYCLNKYKTQIQSESLISSGLKYYKYLGMNNSTHQCMFDEFQFTQTKTFSNIFFTNKDSLVHKIKYFCSNEDVYKIIGRPYSMGILLYGKPGTGKTSCIKAIASFTKRHIVDVSLKKIKTQKELSEIFYGNKINGVDIDMGKRLYVLEEFDCIIDRLKDRRLKTNNEFINSINVDTNINGFNRNIGGIGDSTNINHQLKDNDSEGVNLENLLCLLDGTVELRGSMFIATTNYIDLIDKALIRPGRFDCCIEFDNANHEIIIQMIKHFSKKNIKKLKKEKMLSEMSNSSLKLKQKISQSSNSSSKSTSPKLTLAHIELIKKYSIYNEKFVWSPAKISQICLFYIDSSNYYDDVVNELKKQYDSECKLLQII